MLFKCKVLMCEVLSAKCSLNIEAQLAFPQQMQQRLTINWAVPFNRGLCSSSLQGLVQSLNLIVLCCNTLSAW